MGDDEGACNTGLQLGLGIGDFEPKKKEQNNKGQAAGKSSGLSFSLKIKEEEETAIQEKLDLNGSSIEDWINKKDKYRHQKDVTGFWVESKKLRLTKEQTSLLESSFKYHNTINPGQKQELSKQLNLKPRQVEVWFQNRRARTKWKQRESERELLKKWCRSLREENRRLKMELQNLRCRKVGSASFYGHQVSKANTISTCPSCRNMTWPRTDDSKKCRRLQ